MTAPDLEPLQTAQQAAAQLNETESLVRAAQTARKARGEAYVRAKALHKRELRKARLKHLDASSDAVRNDAAADELLDAKVVAEAAKVAADAGLAGLEVLTVGDLEELADLAKESRDGARDAVQSWERWGSQWQSVVGWCRDDAAREMGGRR
jgi:hypothetical protein